MRIYNYTNVLSAMVTTYNCSLFDVSTMSLDKVTASVHSQETSQLVIGPAKHTHTLVSMKSV